jgi:hypothetical protein
MAEAVVAGGIPRLPTQGARPPRRPNNPLRGRVSAGIASKEASAAAAARRAAAAAAAETAARWREAQREASIARMAAYDKTVAEQIRRSAALSAAGGGGAPYPGGGGARRTRKRSHRKNRRSSRRN